MVTAGGQVEHGVEVGGLAGGGQHGGRAPLQSADFGGHPVVGGVLEPGVEIALCLQIEQGPHGLAGGIAEGGGLYDGDVPGLPVAGGITGVDALGAGLVVWHGNRPSLRVKISSILPSPAFPCQEPDVAAGFSSPAIS